MTWTRTSRRAFGCSGQLSRNRKESRSRWLPAACDDSWRRTSGKRNRRGILHYRTRSTAGCVESQQLYRCKPRSAVRRQLQQMGMMRLPSGGRPSRWYCCNLYCAGHSWTQAYFFVARRMIYVIYTTAPSPLVYTEPLQRNARA